MTSIPLDENKGQTVRRYAHMMWQESSPTEYVQTCTVLRVCACVYVSCVSEGEEGGYRQGETVGCGEVIQADRATAQQHHTVYATLDQLSLQLCFHSGLINMTAEAGSHTQTYT